MKTNKGEEKESVKKNKGEEKEPVKTNKGDDKEPAKTNKGHEKESVKTNTGEEKELVETNKEEETESVKKSDSAGGDSQVDDGMEASQKHVRLQIDYLVTHLYSFMICYSETIPTTCTN